ncbi:MAG TPA: DUF2388 domain-containing protein [Pseudomonas sp.]|nr:DUF2388 domain-containing protein [Pseudomonas sp.]
MRLKLAVATFAVLSLPVGSAMADDDSFLRNVLTSGATTGTSYLTSRDHKLVVAAQDDAGSFVASDGAIRGPYLEAAMQKVRAENPGLQATDMELANAILAKNAIASK